MQRIKAVQCGVIITVFAGFVSTAELVWCKVVQDLDMPYFRIMGCSALLASLIFAFVAKCLGAPVPHLSQAKWALMRALLGTLSFLTAVIAIQVGAGPGDIASLTSINIVCAAVLGHLFLKEKLLLVHKFALLLSVSGAVLISKPEVMFGTPKNSSWIGNLLALLSGFLLACVFICARKSVELSMAHLSSFTAGCASVIFLMLPFSSIVTDTPISVALQPPWVGLALVGSTLTIVLLAIMCDTVGSVLCPAAVSATVRTASSMVSGYIAQVVMFNMTPDTFTLVGALLMLIAVNIMAFARVSYQQQDMSVADEGQQVSDDVSSTCSLDTATESLASFVASEFAECEPHLAARLRRPEARQQAPSNADPKPVARTIGFSPAVVASIAV